MRRKTRKPRRQNYKMPKAIWAVPSELLTWQHKRLLAFIWFCAPKGCHCWNCRLEKRFCVSRRTIQYWLERLRKLELIAIGFPDGPGRTLWPRYRHPMNLEAIPVKKKTTRAWIARQKAMRIYLKTSKMPEGCENVDNSAKGGKKRAGGGAMDCTPR